MKKPSRLEVLEERSRFLRTIREFFFNLDFVEVQTPLLSTDTMVDAAIDPISLAVAGQPHELFLQTSPEFSMKRLLIEGMTRIFEITPAFRNAESGQRHNPEFTMLEWYRVGDSYEQGIELLLQLALKLFPGLPTANVTYAEIFLNKFGVDPHLAESGQLVDLATSHRVMLPDGTVDRDTILQILMSELIEPGLGQDSLCIVRDWPASQSALSKLRMTDQGYSVAERFELYVSGVELANGYHELTDADEQRQRMRANNQSRKIIGLRELPEESKLLERMTSDGLPDCCGVAAGIDRMLMVKLGLQYLSDVMAYDFANA